MPAQKTILLNVNHLLVWHKIFVTDTICLVQNILGPVNGQGIGYKSVCSMFRKELLLIFRTVQYVFVNNIVNDKAFVR